MVQPPPGQRVPGFKRALFPEQHASHQLLEALHVGSDAHLALKEGEEREKKESDDVMAEPVVSCRACGCEDAVMLGVRISRLWFERAVHLRYGIESGEVGCRHFFSEAIEKHDGGVGARIAFDWLKNHLQPLFRDRLIDKKVEAQVTRHLAGGAGSEFLRESQHRSTQGGGWRERFIMHQQFRRRTGHERFDVPFDNESMGAVLLAANVLLQHPWLGAGNGNVGDMLVGFAHGSPWK